MGSAILKSCFYALSVSNGPPVNFEIVERGVTPTVCIKPLWEKKSIERTVECFFLQLSQNWKHFVVNNDWTHSLVKLTKLIPKFQNKLTSLYANIVVLFFSWSCQLLQNIYSLIMKNHILSALVANSIRGFNLSSTQKIEQEQKFLIFFQNWRRCGHKVWIFFERNTECKNILQK